MDVLCEKPEISRILKQNVLIDYIMNIRSRAEYGRKLIMKQFEDRLDHQCYMINVDKHTQAMKYCMHDGRRDNPIYQSD